MDEAEVIANKLKPPRCPKCGAEIDHLRCYEKAWSTATCYINEDYLIVEYSDWDILDVTEVEYHCPKCDEVLFESEEEARKFLKGEADE